MDPATRIVVLSAYKDLRQRKGTESVKVSVNTFEVLGCGWERMPCTPGHPKDQGRAMLEPKQGKFPTSTGRGRQKPDTFLGWELDVTMLAIFRGPQHQDLADVYSGSAVCFRSACCGRPDPYAQDVSAVCHDQRGEVVAHPSLASNGIREVRVRQGSRKASLSVTGAAVFTSCEVKVSEAITSAGILWVLRLRSPHLRWRSPPQVRLGRVAGPRTVDAYHSEQLL